MKDSTTKTAIGAIITALVLGLFIMIPIWQFVDGILNQYDKGYEAGVEDGYHSGHEDGYDYGYLTGLTEDNKSKYDDGYNYGCEIGFDEGYLAGYEDAYERYFSDIIIQLAYDQKIDTIVDILEYDEEEINEILLGEFGTSDIAAIKAYIKKLANTVVGYCYQCGAPLYEIDFPFIPALCRKCRESHEELLLIG